MKLTTEQVLKLVAEATQQARKAIEKAAYGASRDTQVWLLNPDDWEQLVGAVRRLESLAQVVPMKLNSLEEGRLDDSPESRSSTEDVVRPFPDATAYRHTHGGQLCVGETGVRVASLIRRFADGYSLSSALEALSLSDNFNTTLDCLYGLADWIEDMDWMRQETSTGRWISGEELAEFRKWQQIKPKDGWPKIPLPGPVTEEMHELADEKEPGICDKCGHPPAPGNVIYEDSGRRPLCPSCNLKPQPVEKRCGTCREGRAPEASAVRVPCNHYADSMNRPDGPPWENCRFWKPLEGK